MCAPYGPTPTTGLPATTLTSRLAWCGSCRGKSSRAATTRPNPRNRKTCGPRFGAFPEDCHDGVHPAPFAVTAPGPAYCCHRAGRDRRLEPRLGATTRSEERRVGKECRARWVT